MNINLAETANSRAGDNIAIIGMSCRCPGADDYFSFWNNLIDGQETLSEISLEDSLNSGVELNLLKDRNYVPIKGMISMAEYFDASFWSFTELDAKVLDPQIRIFMESVVMALDDAFLDLSKFKGKVGVYAGVSTTKTYYEKVILANKGAIANIGEYKARLLNMPDTLAGLLAYKLNLTGPCLTVQTACSTSLAAIAEACKSLKLGDCDIAIAGGVSITFPLNFGYLHQEGMIHSKSGRCRPFDHKSDGCVRSDGCGVIILKRLEDAIKDSDCIHAVIKGYGVSNDGSFKLGFSAPSKEGQKAAIEIALKKAKINIDDICFLETHGTATQLGDLIEYGALAELFANRNDPLYLGALKANIGHTDVASGVLGLIKTILVLEHKSIPKLIHFEQINKNIHSCNKLLFNTSNELLADDRELCAGVSSFGVSGTNVHIILQSFMQNKKRSKKRLTEVFPDRKKYIIKAPVTPFHNISLEQQNLDLDALLYHPVWKKNTCDVKARALKNHEFLIISNDGETIQKIKNALCDNGLEVRKISSAICSINTKQDSEVCWGKYCSDSKYNNVYIIYAPIIEDEHLLSLNIIDQAFFLLKPLLSLTKQLKGVHYPNNINLLLFSSMNLLEDKNIKHIAQSSLWGFVKSISYEYKNIVCRLIDFPIFSSQIFSDFFEYGSVNKLPEIICFYNKEIYSLKLEACRFEYKNNVDVIKTNGVYIITGGLGKIGSYLARKLYENYQATLILVSRSKEIPHSLSLIPSSNYEIYSLDIADLQSVQSLFSEIIKKYGTVDGIFHAAGVIGGGAISSIKREEFARTLTPKTIGTINLIKVLAENKINPDFIVCFSSRIVFSSSFGQLDYCTANFFLDLYARSLSLNAKIINWDGWKRDNSSREDDRFLNINYGVALHKNFEILKWALMSNYKQIVVLSEKGETKLSSTLKINPLSSNDLMSSYVESDKQIRSKKERDMLTLWCEFLGNDLLQIDDDFFEKGGDSLLAIQLAQKINNQFFGGNISASDMMLYPTVKTLVAFIEQKLSESF